ncbi:DUF192 domain-containing protein [Halomarina litorea]|uniref:DUF192 domain-containing protein n=1 Tax=Halomarina litorea TaxID=2961595 RepID=UPI0020C283D7|nr:DUF192 domain-containing protein [Halomarina sp. BCD28]
MAPSPRRVGTLLAGVFAALLVGVALVLSGVIPLPAPAADDYERTTVAVYDEDGTELGSVDARVADTFRKRYTGLSSTTSLPPGEGMWFAFDEPGEHTFVMRDMDFGIDIVYVAANGTITSIHHAPEPPEGADGKDFRYPGEGQYVLEVNYGWTTDHGVEVGDRVVVGDDAFGPTNETVRSVAPPEPVRVAAA